MGKAPRKNDEEKSFCFTLVYVRYVCMYVYVCSLLHTVYNDKQRTDVDGSCIINDVFHLRFARGELYVLMPDTRTHTTKA